MTTQPEFDFRVPACRAKRGPALAAKMMRILAARQTWTTRAYFRTYHALSDRDCRLGREWAHGRILRGQQGYKLMRYATPEEIRESLAAWQSQIKSEQKQYAMQASRAHRALAKKGEL